MIKRGTDSATMEEPTNNLRFRDRRLENMKRNEELLHDLGLTKNRVKLESEPRVSSTLVKARKQRVRRVVEPQKPTRSSARLANALSRPSYNQDGKAFKELLSKRTKSRHTTTKPSTSLASFSSPAPTPDLVALQASWTSWEVVGAPPTQDNTGTYHFESHPEFTPNKSPEDTIREGSFGGSYWRPLYSKHLKTTITDDWRELPASWTTDLNIDTYLTSPTYNPEINKYGVTCGQSIEDWEAAGWIVHQYDVRGWFQWYCRFWMGRRCPDDERQISRWKKCVGPTGRWRRTLLKKYVQQGIQSVVDEGDKEDEERGDVSPVVHQTCHHWAYEVHQDALDMFWAEGR